MIGCSSNPVEKDPPLIVDEKVDEKESSEPHILEVNLNILNKDVASDSHYIYFVIPGAKETEPGKATQSGKSLPYKTNSNGNLLIDLSEDYNLQYLIDHPDSKNPGSLELYVTTKEDIYIRNPLNKETIVDFEIVKDESSGLVEDYLFKSQKLNLDIIDKYPDGVLSLTFVDAVFVVKLNFDPPTKQSAYEVSLYLPDENSENGIGIIRIGRLAREFQYWDTPFYANEVTGSRAVVITDNDTNEIIEYEGYPLWLKFNDDGTCKDGDIINIKMPPGS